MSYVVSFAVTYFIMDIMEHLQYWSWVVSFAIVSFILLLCLYGFNQQKDKLEGVLE